MKKIRLSVSFDVLPEDEDAILVATKKWLQMSYHVNRLQHYRKEVIVGEKT